MSKKKYFKNRLLNVYVNAISALGFKRMHFIHIGKTGGSYVRHVFASNARLSGIVYFSGQKLFVMHDHDFTLFDCPRKDKVFFVVRDPIDRFVSGFNSRKRQGRPKNNNPWNEMEKIAFNKFNTPDELAGSLYKDGDIGKQAASAMRGIGHVNTSYWDWFGDKEYLVRHKDKIAAVLRTRYLSEDLNSYSNMYCPELKMPSENDLSTHRTPSGFSTGLSHSSIDNLKKWYSKDYMFIETLKEMGFI